MDFFEMLAMFVPFVVLSLLSSIESEQMNQMQLDLENGKIIETHINTTKGGYNRYFVILENSSGDLVEYDVDLNTYIDLGGKFENRGE